MNSPRFSSFDTKALDQLSTELDCHLSIQIGLFDFSYAIFNDHKCIGIESYAISLSEIEKSVNQINWLNKTYSSINISMTSSKFSLLPAPLFDKKHLRKYLNINYRKIENIDIFHDEINSINSYVVYGISKAEQDFIKTFFPKSTINHFSSRLIPNLITQNKNLNCQKIIVNVGHKHLNIIVIDNSNLVFNNTFFHRTPEDCLYYILFTCEQLNLNPESVILEFMGQIQKSDTLYELVYTYVRQVEFRKGQIDLSPNLKSIESHQFYPLLHQHL